MACRQACKKTGSIQTETQEGRHEEGMQVDNKQTGRKQTEKQEGRQICRYVGRHESTVGMHILYTFTVVIGTFTLR